jgi:hypothetical protein
MICETNSFNSYKVNNSIIFETTTEKTENSLNVKKNNYIKGNNELLKPRKSDKLINIFNQKKKNKKDNETKTNSSNISLKKIKNNYLFITKNVFLIKELNIGKEFLTEILIGLKKDEKINIPQYSHDIFKNQDPTEINEKHRAVVIEWLSYIILYFSQSNETLFICINIMDRYISKKKIALNNYQLVGISSYLIASKYEDTNSPSVDDLIYISKNIYTHNDIIEMEKDILSVLNFDIFSVSSYQFFSFFYLVSNLNNKILFCLGHLILELCLLNIDIMSYDPSQLAIASLLIAKKSLELKGGLSNIKSYYNYNESDIKEIQKKIVLFLNHIVYSDKNCLILEKFEKKKYLSVSYIFKCSNKCNMCNNICYQKNKSCK